MDEKPRRVNAMSNLLSIHMHTIAVCTIIGFISCSWDLNII